ncbi:MAG: AHH domain-containing protein, partial [Planctomycetes bacterium]|nr:AHH domain-containing protein [Planctomycetota bacterium]
NPLADDVEHLPEPDPATSREVRFEMTKPSGNRSWCKFIWTLDEIEAAGAKVGATVDFDMPELGIVGPARYTYIGPCPEFKEGDGNLVIGVFKHEPDGPIVNVHIEGLDTPIGSTANHPFWSEDRQEFVEAGHLQPNEQVWSELRGVVRITSVTRAPDAKYVYNLTVHNQHVYEVSELGVVVHNSCSWLQKALNAGMTIPLGMIRAHGHHIVFKGAWTRSREMAKILGLSRRVLRRVGIKVNDIENIMILGNVKRVHTKTMARKVLRELLKVRNGSKNEVIRALRNIATKWQDGVL